MSLLGLEKLQPTKRGSSKSKFSDAEWQEIMDALERGCTRAQVYELLPPDRRFGSLDSFMAAVWYRKKTRNGQADA